MQIKAALKTGVVFSERKLIMTVQEMREMCTKGDALRDKDLTTPEDTVRFDDIVYGADPEWQVLDVYKPKAQKDEKLPVIVNIHGGGWVYGNKEVYQYYCLSLAQRGFAVVNFTYRLAPENKFPAAVEDINSVYAWIFENSEKYGLDTNNIFAVGDSAGGHYNSLYTAFATNPEYQDKIGLKPPKDLKFRAVALNCGAYTPYCIDGKQDWAVDNTRPEGTDLKAFSELMTVPNFVTKDYPPVFIMTCSADFLKTQPLEMIPKFMQYDIEFVYRFYGDAENKLPHVFHCDINRPEATVCNDDEIDFFKRHIVK